MNSVETYAPTSPNNNKLGFGRKGLGFIVLLVVDQYMCNWQVLGSTPLI